MQNKRVLYFDILNVFSCFSVIVLHCNGYAHSLDHNDSIWWFRVLIEVLFFNAVPLFFMLSGATLIGYHKRYDTKTFFKKRIKKTFVPYVFLSICFCLLFLVYSYITHGGQSFTYIVKLFILALVTGRAPYTTYWFFIPLFLLYLLIPFISVMMEHLTGKQQLALISLIFVLQSCFMPLASLSPTCMVSINFMKGLPVGNFVIYILLGYYISHNPVEENKSAVRALVFFSLILMLGRYVLVYNISSHDDIAFDYTSAYTVVPSATIFLLAKRYFGNLQEGRALRFFSKRSFGVYLIQQFIICIMFHFISKQSVTALIMIPAVYLICVAIVYIVQQFKYTRWIMP